jgi:hypothetical protein
MTSTAQHAADAGRFGTGTAVLDAVVAAAWGAALRGGEAGRGVGVGARPRHPGAACDVDHTNEYAPMAEGGPPGQTNPDNLACLCRRHHRCKTFTRWRYRRRPDGTYEWTDPAGKRFLVVPRGGGTYPFPDADQANGDRDTGPPGHAAA